MSDVLNAIQLLRDHLRDSYISEECRTAPCFGCISCQAVALDTALAGLANAETTEDAAGR